MKQRILRRGATLAALVCAFVFATAATAVAGPDPTATDDPPFAAPYCPPTNLCLWAHSGFRGGNIQYPYDVSDLRNFAWREGCEHETFNDCASSAINSGVSCTVYMRVHINFRGGYHSLSRGHTVRNFASSTSGYRDPSFNDAVSSFRWCSP